MSTPTPTIESFKDRLKIDRLSLDTELVEQPGLYYEICEQYAMAVSRRDQAHDGYKQVDAERSIRHREKLAKNDAKVTEGRIREAVASDPKFLEAKATHVRASLEVEKWQALKESFQQRAWVLKDLTQLFISGYFQSNSAKGGATTAVQQMAYEDNKKKLKAGRERL